MLKRKSPLNRIFRLPASHTWMTENKAKVLLIMLNNSLRLEVRGLNKFIERSLENICSDKKDNLQEYLLKINDKFSNNELFYEE